MNLKVLKHIYFLGIGGIGMSAIARWFIANGYSLAGYDKTATPLTNALQAEGIPVHFSDDINLIPAEFLANKEETLIVYTPAIPKDNLEFNYLKDNGFTLMKRSQVLGLLTKSFYTIAVSGTHGKTTTSSMVSHILKQAGKNVTAFLGGITQNYGTNFLINESPDNVICVVEADEFDRSFLTLYPNLTIVTSTDADHLDIYGDHSQLLESFQLFVSQLKDGGKLYQRKGLNLAGFTKNESAEYSLNEGDFYAQNLRIENAEMIFDIIYPNGIIKDCTLLTPGFHNVENALAATAVALEAGLTAEQIKQGICSFGGVKRRFEYHIRSEKIVYIDDYAHHPTEIQAFLSSVKALYPKRKLTVVFQPHLFTRTRDFQEGFAESLSLADDLILLDIYPARELPIEGVTSEIIFDKVTSPIKTLCSKEEVLDLLEAKQPELIVTVGAGDIDTLIPKIKEWGLV
ncbi:MULTISPECIES: UDP-N-acetylmuramate--L-alanine ligase [unclassified Arcicella]|uniref:UDP-N-acetylmuramate--L-alanine ligase n=1 Tax=unclassified Arcicella TaxID=2644986 RepID=UPI0028658CB8|nr:MULTISPECIES: UDP-N-acetylmuramate--L-alanine ligase [unclassified Arcicella]MDR6561327.1 UDP-N-acetylmuramate--alanine ligase [Arcicella sp. BE51]MDR6811211.1 UDP-N-acetylmuramate--alanine ligase [Arcicella sp. BE140]MDR6822561.1 UDP-N-acetylmuramate--alanine ligase [Arcicella sp. BE139]